MRSQRRNIIIAAVIVVLAASWYTISRVRSEDKNKPDAQTTKVERGTVERIVSASGVLQPLTTIDVKSNAGGSVDVLAVDVGSIVQPGQLIAKIDPTDSRTALEQAEADLSASNARLSQARETLTLQVEQNALSVKQAEEAYQAAKARLAQAEAQSKAQPSLTKASIQQAEANHKSAQESLRQLRDAGIPQGMAQTKAANDQAKATLDKADRNYKRQQELYDKGFISTSQLDIAKLEYENARAQASSAKERMDTSQQDYDAQLKAAEARLAQTQAALDNAKANSIQDQVRAQEVVAARASLAQSATALEAAKSNTRQNRIRAADIRSAEAQIIRNKAQADNARVQLDYTIITAPRAAIVLKKYVEEGTIITSGRSSFAGTGQGTSLVQLGDLSRMFVLASVDETDIAEVKVGQLVDVTLDAYPNEVFVGTVTKIDPQTVVEQNVTTVPVTIEITNPDERLKPGMNAVCDFIIERKDNVLTLPIEVVTEQRGRHTVTIMADGVETEREVKVGISGEDRIEIISGLREGDLVMQVVALPNSSGNRNGGRPGGPGGPMPGVGGMSGQRRPR